MLNVIRHERTDIKIKLKEFLYSRRQIHSAKILDRVGEGFMASQAFS